MSGKLEREAAAWAWARREALTWTDGARQWMCDSLDTYLANATDHDILGVIAIERVASRESHEIELGRRRTKDGHGTARGERNSSETGGKSAQRWGWHGRAKNLCERATHVNDRGDDHPATRCASHGANQRCLDFALRSAPAPTLSSRARDAMIAEPPCTSSNGPSATPSARS